MAAEEIKNKEEPEEDKKSQDEKKKKIKTGVRFSLRIKFSLAIISLVAIIIVTVTGYFVVRESRLLKDQYFSSINREIVHLANTSQEAIGIDELALLSAIKDLERLPYIKYAFILNKDNRIIQYFDKRTKRVPGENLEDSVNRNLSDEKGEISVAEYTDPAEKSVTLYDFSRVVLNRVDKKKIGVVIIGLSDSIIQDEINRAVINILYISLIMLFVSVFGAILLATITINPIKKLSFGAARIGSGDLDHRINIKTTDELGQLAREFNEMTSLIKDAKEKEIEQRVMDEQLEVAKDIQEGLNPMGYYNKKGVQIKGFTRAAKGVGGDYFDYLDIDENRVGALISDVSGKGVPASLVMVMIRTVFTSYVSLPGIDCANVVRAINDSLSADFAIDKFATLFFLIYDRRTEEVTFSNAGHGPLLVYRKERKQCTATKLDGVPIGIMEDVDYKQAKVKLNPGDMIIMFSDGITEMRNPEKEEYGLDKVLRMMIDHNNLNADEFVNMLVDDVDEFRGEASPHDDMTVLLFKRES